MHGYDGQRLPGEVKASIAKSLGDPSPEALRWIVHLSWKNPALVKRFLDAMLSQSLSWHGDIDLAGQSSLQCVDAINSGDGTIEEVRQDYEDEYPGIVARVQSHPDLKGKTEVK
jgi:hypothetical protein